MSESTYMYFLRDSVEILYRRGMEIREEYAAKRLNDGTDAALFENGLVVGYYECLSKLLSQAQAFSLPVDELFRNINPDYLMSLSQSASSSTSTIA